jgi:uncharacterized membrane protein YqiK
MLKRNILIAVIALVIVLIIVFLLTKKRWKILPSSANVLHVKYGKEYGVLEITPTQELVLESQGIRFVGINRENKTIGVISLATGKEAKINYQNKTIA